MLYLVQVNASMDRANQIDAGDGPGPTFGKIVDRFRPEAIYGSPNRRTVIMIVNLETELQMAELMYALTWFTHSEPTFAPIMKVEVYGEAITNAKRTVAPQS
jgi:hypothetical protein